MKLPPLSEAKKSKANIELTLKVTCKCGKSTEFHPFSSMFDPKYFYESEECEKSGWSLPEYLDAPEDIRCPACWKREIEAQDKKAKKERKAIAKQAPKIIEALTKKLKDEPWFVRARLDSRDFRMIRIVFDQYCVTYKKYKVGEIKKYRNWEVVYRGHNISIIV